MAFDSLVLYTITEELKPRLIGAKINRIHQPDPHTILLRCHGPAGQSKLLLSAHPDHGRVSLTEGSPENPTKAPMFLMVMRKWLENARITDIGCTDGERVACFTLDARDEIGDSRVLRLIIEIMGKHSNIILVDESDTIIDGIRRYGSNLSRYREVLPGRPYLPPPPMDKMPMPPASEEALTEMLWNGAERTLAEQLKFHVKGISPLLVNHILTLAGLDGKDSPDTLGSGDIDRIYRAMTELHQQQKTMRLSPCLRRKHNGYGDFSAIVPACWEPEEIERCDSMNEAVDRFYQQKEEEAAFRRHQGNLKKVLRHHINRMNKKIGLEEADLMQCEAAEAYKTAGDLLAANQWYLEKGMTEAELPSFEDPDVKITVTMDPAKTPQENIQRYYRKYAKAKKARSRIEEQLEVNKEELYQLEGMEQAVEDSSEKDELIAVEREAINAGYIKPVLNKKGKEEPKHQAPLQPREIRTADGFTILIGRNNKQNDKLSLKMAKEDDIWLHTQKIPGSHVIIRQEDRPIPESVMLEAASYAAWFSKAKNSSGVPVDWVTAGKLKKPQGARPGFVTYTGQKTLYVDPKEPK